MVKTTTQNLFWVVFLLRYSSTINTSVVKRIHKSLTIILIRNGFDFNN